MLFSLPSDSSMSNKHIYIFFFSCISETRTNSHLPHDDLFWPKAMLMLNMSETAVSSNCPDSSLFKIFRFIILKHLGHFFNFIWWYNMLINTDLKCYMVASATHRSLHSKWAPLLTFLTYRNLSSLMVCLKRSPKVKKKGERQNVGSREK